MRKKQTAHRDQRRRYSLDDLRRAVTDAVTGQPLPAPDAAFYAELARGLASIAHDLHEYAPAWLQYPDLPRLVAARPRFVLAMLYTTWALDELARLQAQEAGTTP